MGRNPTVTVKSDPTSGQRRGDWVVEANGRQVSRHRTKSAAKSKAKQYARARDGQVRIQNTSGTWSQGPSY